MLDWRPESVAGVTIFSVVDVCESVCVGGTREDVPLAGGGKLCNQA